MGIRSLHKIMFLGPPFWAQKGGSMPPGTQTLIRGSKNGVRVKSARGMVCMVGRNLSGVAIFPKPSQEKVYKDFPQT